MIRVHPEVSALLTGGDVAGARAALQAAVRLEHSTIPPYLYALYSLAPGGNQAAAQVLRSAVVEKMLHMTLAVNVLNAIGGRPDVDSPLMLPRYPANLPGTAEDGLIVGLAPFSVALVRDTFLRIQRPEPAGAGQAQTIGQFYQEIRATLAALGDAAFTGARQHQVTGDVLAGCVEVTDVRSARAAIDRIAGRGEGTPSTPAQIAGPGAAHYHRFAEIAVGRRPVPVFNAPLNPAGGAYPPGSAARGACDAFNYSYTSLLRGLHLAFNGQPRKLSEAIGLMGSLRRQAVAMMSGAATGGAPVGPTFEWQSVQSKPAR